MKLGHSLFHIITKKKRDRVSIYTYRCELFNVYWIIPPRDRVEKSNKIKLQHPVRCPF